MSELLSNKITQELKAGAFTGLSMFNGLHIPYKDVIQSVFLCVPIGVLNLIEDI